MAITHNNLDHNCLAIEQAMEISVSSVVLTALPLFHDMGLVGGVLVSMYTGCEGNFLAPNEFVQFPERWLKLISLLGVTHSGGPNFMYDLACQMVTDVDLGNCDLSSWKVAFCGAEPIRLKTLEEFSQAFAKFGFVDEAFFPCYGMAESTLFVSGIEVGAKPKISYRHGQGVISCGTPGIGFEVVIVNPDTQLRTVDGEIGEIWVHGLSVAKGYWGRKEVNKDIFEAQICGELQQLYLRTGDLGFFESGELFVASRMKDTIIVNGKKFLPHDIEEEAERSHCALSKFGGAAFTVVHNETEKIILVFELKREWLHREYDWPDIVASIRKAVFLEFGLQIGTIIFIKPGRLPRTSSGKVKRSQCKQDYLSGNIEMLKFGFSFTSNDVYESHNLLQALKDIHI